MVNQVVVFDFSGHSQFLLRRLKKTALISLSALKKRKFYLEIYLVSNVAIRFLNRRFRKCDQVTNVLSFPAKGDFPDPILPGGFVRLGEVYLAPDHIRAKGENIYLLLIHGILHLLGYTHKGKRDTIEMEKREKQIFKIVDGKLQLLESKTNIIYG